VRALGLLVAILAGVGLAGQGRVNGELGHRLGDGVAAAVVSFGSGLVLLALAAAALPVGRRGLAALRAAWRTRRLRWWECAGGVVGGYFVATQGLTVTALGLAVFTVAVVAGQVVSSLLVDRAGLGPGGPRPISAPRVAAATLAVVAVVVAVADRAGSPRALVLATLPAVAGIAVAWQQAMNGRVQARAGALSAALLNFGVGTATLAACYAVVAAVRGVPAHWPAGWWLYTGGALGIVFVLAAVVVVRVTGVLMLGLGLIAGQVLGSLLLDAVAPARDAAPSGNEIVGALLTLVAVAVAALPAGRRIVVPGG